MPQNRNSGPSSSGTQHEQSVSNPVALVKPRLRGVSHQYTAYIAAPVGLLLTLKATTRKAAIGSLVYTASLVVLFSISALYHRPTWQPQQRKWMRRLDHAAIFFLIAGTYTPICLLALPGSPGEQLLITVWTGALIGVAQSLFWVTAPKALVTALYLLLGWAGVKSVGQLRDTGVLLVACGGAAYTLGGMYSVLPVFLQLHCVLMIVFV
jgi:hemolysin III